MSRPIIIIIIGIRGCGKSTLGLLALARLNYKYIDAEEVVTLALAMPDHIYILNHSLDAYQKLQYQVILPLIRDQKENLCVVLPSLIIENTLLCKYLENQPYIVSIEREEAKVLENCLNGIDYDNEMGLYRDDAATLLGSYPYEDPQWAHFEHVQIPELRTSIFHNEGIREQLPLLIRKYRHLARFNYYNIESNSKALAKRLITDSQLDTLTLKEVQLQFTAFLRHISQANLDFESSSHLELDAQNRHSCALQFDYPASASLEILNNISATAIGCDAIKICLDLVQLVEIEGIQNVEGVILKLVSTLRRQSSLPLMFSIKNTAEELFALKQGFLNINSESLSSISSPETVKSSGGFNVSTPNSTSEASSSVSSTFQTTSFDGKYSNIDFYFKFLSMALKFGLDYVELDLLLCTTDQRNSDALDIIIADDNTTEIAAKMVQRFLLKKGTTKVMGIYHSDDESLWTSENGASRILKFASTLGLTLVTITGLARDLAANLDLWNFLRAAIFEYPEIYVSSYNTGPIGRLSKIMNRFLTPVYSLSFEDIRISGLNSDKIQLADVQRALQQAFQIPVCSYFMIGHEVTAASTLMPSIQNFLNFRMGMINTYNSFETDQISDVLNIIKSTDFGGAWLLKPFLHGIFQYVDTVSDHAKAIGSINILLGERSLLNPLNVERLIGDNTDWRVITELLNLSLSPINLFRENRTALVIGSCDVSHATVYALIHFGFEHIIIYDDNYGAACAMKEQMLKCINMLKQCIIYAIDDEQFDSVLLPSKIVTPTAIILGQLLSQKSVSISLKWFENSTGGVIIDSTIELLNSTIIELASNADGWIALNGLNYLATQAAIHFEYMVNKPAPRELIVQHCLHEISKMGN